MAYSTARLTCYALLSAIEDDLRIVASTHLADLDPETALAEAYVPARERAMRDLGVPAATLSELIRYIDFQDTYKLLNRCRTFLPSSYADHIKEVTGALNKLVPVRNRVAHTRPLDYEDFSLVIDTARGLAETRDFPWDGVREVLNRLSEDPSFVLGLDVSFPNVEQRDDRHNLPIPEYDETGFIGRKTLVRTLSQQLKSGPYPVVSIVGDGGIGKTSLALKVAYEILDSTPCPFDATVWVSAKTSALTPTEIVRIEGAITDSLGMLSAAAEVMGAPSGIVDPMAEVLEYLGEFRILLVLDNLETVLDERLKDFLGNLPSGSKILITSRIGVGSFEHPIRLGSLDQSDAVKLFRTLTRLRNIEVLDRLNPQMVERWVNRMGRRPLYIRWFVQAVQAGARPEDVLQSSNIFLDYCMSTYTTT